MSINFNVNSINTLFIIYQFGTLSLFYQIINAFFLYCNINERRASNALLMRFFSHFYLFDIITNSSPANRYIVWQNVLVINRERTCFCMYSDYSDVAEGNDVNVTKEVVFQWRCLIIKYCWEIPENFVSDQECSIWRTSLHSSITFSVYQTF